MKKMYSNPVVGSRTRCGCNRSAEPRELTRCADLGSVQDEPRLSDFVQQQHIEVSWNAIQHIKVLKNTSLYRPICAGKTVTRAPWAESKLKKYICWMWSFAAARYIRCMADKAKKSLKASSGKWNMFVLFNSIRHQYLFWGLSRKITCIWSLHCCISRWRDTIRDISM